MENPHLLNALEVAKVLMEQHKMYPATADVIFHFIDWIHDFVSKNYSERVLFLQYSQAERTELYSRTSRFRKILMTLKRCADLQIEMNAIFRSPGWGVAVYSNSPGHFTKSVRPDHNFEYNLSMVCPEDIKLSTDLETASVLPYTKSSPIVLPDMKLNMESVPFSKGKISESPITIPGTPVAASPISYFHMPVPMQCLHSVPSSASMVTFSHAMQPIYQPPAATFLSVGGPEKLSMTTHDQVEDGDCLGFLETMASGSPIMHNDLQSSCHNDLENLDYANIEDPNSIWSGLTLPFESAPSSVQNLNVAVSSDTKHHSPVKLKQRQGGAVTLKAAPASQLPEPPPDSPKTPVLPLQSPKKPKSTTQKQQGSPPQQNSPPQHPKSPPQQQRSPPHPPALNISSHQLRPSAKRSLDALFPDTSLLPDT